MRLFRFMSNKEFEEFQSGEDLINFTFHDKSRKCIGFCFFNLDEIAPEEVIHSVSGIVSFDKCVIFEIPNDSLVYKTYGYYAKPVKYTDNMELNVEILLSVFDKDERMKLNEYCTPVYSSRFFKPVKYTEDIWSQWNVNPAEQQELKWKNI